VPAGPQAQGIHPPQTGTVDAVGAGAGASTGTGFGRAGGIGCVHAWERWPGWQQRMQILCSYDMVQAASTVRRRT